MGKDLTRRRSDQALRVRGVPAHAGGARDGLHRGRHVRGRAALPDVLQGRIVPPAVDQPVVDQPPGRYADRAAAAARSDIILFKSMSIHGGSPKTDGYQEEHAAGLIGCATGNAYHYSKNDSYYAYTDFESIDIAIANKYKATAATVGAAVLQPAHRRGRALRRGQRRARPALHLVPQAPGGRRAVRQRDRADAGRGAGLRHADGAREPAVLAARSNQPVTDTSKVRAALARKKSLIDFRLGDIADAKRVLGMDSAHAHQLDGLVDGWREVEKANNASSPRSARRPPAAGRRSRPARQATRPTGNGTKKLELRRAVAGPRSDDQPDQAGLRVGPDPRRRLHAVGRVERPVDAQPRRHARRTTRWSTATTSPA